MSSVKKWAVGACAGMAVCASMIAVAQVSPTVVVGKQSQPVQTPSAAGASGIGYSQTSATESSLVAHTKGFMFCGNAGTTAQTASTLTIAHEDQGFTPAHPWTFASVTDVQAFSYNSGVLDVTPGLSLTCLATTENGGVGSGLREGIFDNGYDSATDVNYNNLVNWTPPAGFVWNAQNWDEVPVDPCTATANNPARVVEDVTCAAVSGVRPAAAGATTGPVRAGTIWTANDFTNFTYVFRVDARFGPQTSTISSPMAVPSASAPSDPTATTQVNLKIYDAFDSTFLTTTGHFCVLTALPTTLNANVCSGATHRSFNDSGVVEMPLSVGEAPDNQPTKSFYIAVTRAIHGAHASNTAPAVGVAILVEPAAATEGGDKFSGDDVIFGFQPAAGAGFPWMKEQ